MPLHRANMRDMKYEHLMNDNDRAEIVKSTQLKVEGSALRQRVLARLRARAFRLAKEVRHD